MSPRGRLWAVIGATLAVVAVVVLAAGIPEFALLPGVPAESQFARRLAESCKPGGKLL